LVLPNANNFPSLPAQLAAHASVTFPIGRNFGVPKFLVATWSFVTFLTTVPKAAVHKNHNPLVSDCETGFARKRLITPPTGDTVLPENLDQTQLRRFVSARTNQRYYFVLQIKTLSVYSSTISTSR
jgi:hypothetical protein